MLRRPAPPLAILCVLLATGGCASQYSVRTLPSVTPAADNAAVLEQMQQMQQVQQMQADAAAAAARAAAAREAELGPPLTVAQAPPLATYDPWERMNRFTYRFNARFDEAIFLPVADGYRRFLPSPVRAGVHNFFSNYTEIISILNYTAQLRLAPAVRSLGRFVVNTTLGIGGLWDVATPMHLIQPNTGFGNTLARWGIHPGPYLVMPLLGPSSLRDGFGWGVDFSTNWFVNIANLARGTAGWALTPLNAVDIRANTNFRYYSTGSPFEYSNIRFLYVRKTLIEDDALRLWHRAGPPDPLAPAGQ